MRITDPLVQAMGAVNTVLFGKGQPEGFNTDYSGFLSAYRAARGELAPGVVLLIGAGGVGRSLAFALAGLGAAELRIADLDSARAGALANALRAGFPDLPITLGHSAAESGTGGRRGPERHPRGNGRARWHPTSQQCDARAGLGLRRGLYAGRHRLPDGCRRRGPDHHIGLRAVHRPGRGRMASLRGPAAGRGTPARPSGRTGCRMKTGIATVSIAGDFATKLGAIAAAGYDGIEIFEQDFLASDLSPRAAGQMVRDHGLEVLLLQPFRDFEGLPDPLRARAFTRARRKFALMNELGTDLMLICSSVHPQSLGGIDRAAGDLAELGAIAAEYGVRVGYEALAWGRHVDDHRDAWEIVRRADHPQIGLILDSYHTLARGIDPDTIRRIPGEKIFFVQLADAPAISMDLLYLSRHFRCMPGEGNLDVNAFMRAVLSTGYDGPLSLEVFNDQFRAGLPRLVALDGHRSLINLMDGVRRASPSLAVDLPDMPAPASVERVAFIEFVTAPGDAPWIDALLESLGFRLTGKHVSKAVRRFQQNAVNILVNTEQQGYAHSAFLSHGTCVSEIAIVVPNARQTFARGKALLAEPFGDGPNPGELEIPALRGVGGSLLRLLDDHSDLAQLWDVDFIPSAHAGTGAGLIAVDHISQTMPFDEMLSWTQFYTALLAAQKAPMVDVADPEGLVSSQAVKSGALRVTLNGPRPGAPLPPGFWRTALEPRRSTSPSLAMTSSPRRRPCRTTALPCCPSVPITMTIWTRAMTCCPTFWPASRQATSYSIRTTPGSSSNSTAAPSATASSSRLCSA